MLLTDEPLLLTVALLWLPVLALLGAGYTAVAWRLGRSRGVRTLAGTWLAATVVAAVSVTMFIAGQARGWGGRLGTLGGVRTLAVTALPLAACLGAATLVVRRRLALSAGLGVAGVFAGAAAAAGVWLACAALSIAAVRLIR